MSDLEQEELVQLNSLTIPEFLVVGFRSSEVLHDDFSRAVRSRVGAIHVTPPKAWRDGARLDAQLDAVIDALFAREKLPDTWAAYYLGNLTPDEAVAEGFSPLPDVRAANLAIDLQARTFVPIINEALRTLSLKTPEPADRAAVAAEGALRAFRTELSDADAGVARNLLGHLYAMQIFRQGGVSDVNADVEELV